MTRPEIIRNAFKIGSPLIEPALAKEMKTARRREYKSQRTTCPENAMDYVPNLSTKMVEIFKRKKTLTCGDMVTLTGAPLSSVYRGMATLHRAGLIQNYRSEDRNYVGELKSYKWVEKRQRK